MLARTQIAVAGNERWRRLSRQELLIKIAGMGVSPLNPSRCYVIARAGPPDERELRVFEVREFADSPERTSVFVVGRDYGPPLSACMTCTIISGAAPGNAMRHESGPDNP